MQKFNRLIGLTGVLLLVFAISIVGAQDMKTLVTSLSMVGGDIPTIDPGLAETSSSIEVINQIFIGLTSQEETTGAPEDGIATYTVEGSTYTFSIMPDIYWVRYNAESGAVEQVMDDAGNPRTVTAGDVAYGMLRSLNPETASPYSYVLVPYIVGAAEFNSGEGAMEDVAIEVVDDLTLNITAPEAVSFAPSIYGLWMARAVPQWAIEEYGDLWVESENIQTFGPYALKEWLHDESITIVKNPFWAGTDAVPAAKIDEVTFRFLDPAQAFAEYLAGNIDAADVPLEEIERVKADPTLSEEYVVGTNPCTYYIGFDNVEAPTDNVHLRRALSFAIDRQSIVDNVTRGGQIPAQWFARPGLNAAPTLETHPDLGALYDPALAQEEFALALEELGMTAEELSAMITLSYNDSSGHAAIMQAIQQMYQDTLGISVTLTPLEPSTYFASLSEEAPAVYRAGWCQDYADANNFLYDVFYSASSQNDTGFNSPEFDAIVEQARLSSDQAERLELYAQAEQILVVDVAAIAPIYWYTVNQVIKPYVEPTISVTGNEVYYNWDISQ